jgi:nanoRNase/pAp phosphatase (c-di-AMP/oligoRNAs hydrolase)
VGKLFVVYHEHIVENAVHHADLVRFEGYECYVAKASPEFVSDVGNRLARLKPPIALILSADAAHIGVSLRSDRSVDVATIAKKYGGNGHPAAAGFELRYGDLVPWTVVPKA